MRRAAVQGLLARKLRTALTALAVVFGVAMVSGTFVLTDSISRAFNSLFATTYKNASAVISGREIVSSSSALGPSWEIVTSCPARRRIFMRLSAAAA